MNNSTIDKILANISETSGRKVGWQDLTDEERGDIMKYEAAMNQDDMSVEKIKSFIGSEIARAEHSLEKFENSKERDLYLKAVLRNFRILRTFLATPASGRAEAKQNLQSLLGIKL